MPDYTLLTWLSTFPAATWLMVNYYNDWTNNIELQPENGRVNIFVFVANIYSDQQHLWIGFRFSKQIAIGIQFPGLVIDSVQDSVSKTAEAESIQESVSGPWNWFCPGLDFQIWKLIPFRTQCLPLENDFIQDSVSESQNQLNSTTKKRINWI